MKTVLRKIIQHKLFFPIFLLLLSFLAFGILIPWIGFHGDDWSLIWTAYRLNDYQYFFGSNRPTLIPYLFLFHLILAAVPWQWSVTAIFSRWLAGLAVYLFFRELFPDYKKEAGWFAILFVLYPGYHLAFGLTMLTYYLEPFFLFISFYLMILWIKGKNRSWIILALALLASVANLFSSEHFFFLELLRPLVIWITFSQNKEHQPTLRLVLTRWLPFLTLFIGALIWRVATLSTTSRYSASLLTDFLHSPLEALSALAQTVLHDFYEVILLPWVRAFSPDIAFHSNSGAIYILMVALVSISVFIYLFFLGDAKEHRRMEQERSIWFFLGLGLLSFLLAGLPFWIAEIPVTNAFNIQNRIAITQGFGATLILFAILAIILSKARIAGLILISVLAGLFSGIQFSSANQFRDEWTRQKDLIWELAWRAPALKQGTIIIMTDPAFLMTGENSISSAINWNNIQETNPQGSDYFLYFDQTRIKRELPNFQPGQQVDIGHMTGLFSLNTTNTLVLRFAPPGCLRMIDPQIEQYNSDITDYTKEYVPFSNLAVVQGTSPLNNGPIDRNIFWDEPDHGWCYYFEKADLARQLNDWKTVAELSEKAMALNKTPEDYAEYLVYIEGYAHSGNWEKAMQLTDTVMKKSVEYQKMVCTLWARIDQNTPASAQKEQALLSLKTSIYC